MISGRPSGIAATQIKQSLAILGLDVNQRLARITALLAMVLWGAHAAAHEPAPIPGLGRLLVPAVRYENGYPVHYDERCSATVVAPAGHTASTLIISAWHCLEDYRDLSRALLFESHREGVARAFPVLSGGSMHSDWALLRVDRPLREFLPLPESPAAGLHRAALQPVDPSAAERPALLMAGFPRGAGRPGAGPLVRRCTILGRDGADLRGDCILHKGTSGGAVLSGEREPVYLGVISRGDGESQSIFVPVARFLERIRPYF